MKITVNEEDMIDGAYTKGRENEVSHSYDFYGVEPILLSEL